MAVVKASGALLFQQAAADRLYPISWHIAVGRQRVWCAVLLAYNQRDPERAHASFFRARGKRASGLLSDSDRQRDAIAVGWLGADDCGSVISPFLDGSHVGRLAGGSRTVHDPR